MAIAPPFLRHLSTTVNSLSLGNMECSASPCDSHLPCKIQSIKETGNTESPVSPLLRLPPRLRHRIYLHTELLARFAQYGNEKYAMLNLNGGTPIPSRGRYLPDKFDFYGLLLSCRTIYAEASTVLYRHNRFVIRSWEKQSLAPLWNLTPSSFSKLTYLKIVLNQASCHYKHPQAWHEDCMCICDDDRVFNTGYRDGDYRVLDPQLCNAPLEVNQRMARLCLPSGILLFSTCHLTSPRKASS